VPMNDGYLWDKSGTPDPEVERLEQMLGRFRRTQVAPDFPAILPAENRPRTSRILWPLAAAALILFALGLWFTRIMLNRAAWTIANLDGSPRIGNLMATPRERWKVGEPLETDATSRVELLVQGLGQIEVEPNSRLTLLKASPTQQQVRLDRGTIRASIVAPPYVFLVHTPTAYAMDMGCAYTLHVNDDGSSILRVTIGWVDLQHGWRQSLVPAGAAAESRPGIGPGAPYFEDATERFSQALEIVNFNLSDAPARSAALAIVLDEARARDSFTLLNLFRRVDASDRGRLYDRLAALLPPPPGATRDAAVNGDWNSLGPWWDALGIGHAKKGLKGPPRIEE
jgi:hypothetical protein